MMSTNCPNCGAVFDGPRCRYCGTPRESNDNQTEVTVLYADGLPAFEIARDIATGLTEIYKIGRLLHG